MEAPMATEGPASPGAIGARGMRQWTRVLCFAAALVAFATCTYLAFARSSFRPERARDAGVASPVWWLSRIEFNPAGRQHRVESGADFTSISAINGGRDIWIGGTKGLTVLHRGGGYPGELLSGRRSRGQPECLHQLLL